MASSGTGAKIAVAGLVARMASKKAGAQIVGVREYVSIKG
jgi:hypothetical protein